MMQCLSVTKNHHFQAERQRRKARRFSDDDDNDDTDEQSPESGDCKEVGGKMSGFCEWGSGWPPSHIHCQFYYIFYHKLGTASRKK